MLTAQRKKWNQVSFNVRKAQMDDAKKVWEIRNSPEIASLSFSKQSIKLEDHLRWFRKNYIDLADNKCFVIEGEKGTFGYCRMDRVENAYRISIAIESGTQRSGAGSFLLNNSIKMLDTKKEILAEVMNTNQASKNFFEKNRFILKKSEDNHSL